MEICTKFKNRKNGCSLCSEVTQSQTLWFWMRCKYPNIRGVQNLHLKYIWLVESGHRIENYCLRCTKDHPCRIIIQTRKNVASCWNHFPFYFGLYINRYVWREARRAGALSSPPSSSQCNGARVYFRPLDWKCHMRTLTSQAIFGGGELCYARGQNFSRCRNFFANILKARAIVICSLQYK